MGKVTIKNIAEHLNIDPSTVSRALNNHPNIGEEMKEKVNLIAKKLGYQIKSKKGKNNLKKSKLVGLILPKIVRFFISDMIEEIQNYMNNVGYKLLILQSDESLDKEKECIEMCQRFKVDGLLVCLSKETKDIEHFDFFFKNNIPIVFLDKVPKGKGIAKVRISDTYASYIAIKYLIGKGHKNIIGIFTYKESYLTQHRKKGFISALKEHSITLQDDLIIYATSEEEAVKKLSIVLKKENRPTAIFAITDELISGAIRAIQSQSPPIVISEDISLIGISNGWLPKYLHPQITHIRHSGALVGKEAAMYLHHLIEYPNNTNLITKKIDTFLVELESCANINTKKET